MPPTDPETLAKLFAVQPHLLKTPQGELWMQHVLHAGMYARTMTMPPDSYAMGALIRVPTIVITVGEGRVYTGQWHDVKGYNVLAAAAHRKQIFVSETALIVTMILPTSANTVEEAENEFTAESELLISRRTA